MTKLNVPFGLSLGLIATLLSNNASAVGRYEDCLRELYETLEDEVTDADIEANCGKNPPEHASVSPCEGAAVLHTVREGAESAKAGPLTPRACPGGESVRSTIRPEWVYEPSSREGLTDITRPYFEDKVFIKKDIPDDGDCAFSAMGRTRHDFIDRVHRLLDNPQRRGEVIDSLNNSFQEERDRIARRSRSGQSVDSVLRQAIGQFPNGIQSVTEAKKFLDNVMSLRTYYAVDHDIALASQVFGINILLLESVPPRHVRLVPGTVNTYINGSPEVRYLLHNGTNHFDALQLKGAEEQSEKEIAKRRKEEKRKGKAAALELERQYKQEEALRRKEVRANKKAAKALKKQFERETAKRLKEEQKSEKAARKLQKKLDREAAAE